MKHTKSDYQLIDDLAVRAKTDDDAMAELIETLGPMVGASARDSIAGYHDPAITRDDLESIFRQVVVKAVYNYEAGRAGFVHLAKEYIRRVSMRTWLESGTIRIPPAMDSNKVNRLAYKCDSLDTPITEDSDTKLSDVLEIDDEDKAEVNAEKFVLMEYMARLKEEQPIEYEALMTYYWHDIPDVSEAKRLKTSAQVISYRKRKAMDRIRVWAGLLTVEWWQERYKSKNP